MYRKTVNSLYNKDITAYLLCFVAGTFIFAFVMAVNSALTQ